MTWIAPQPKPSRFTNGQRAAFVLGVTAAAFYGAWWIFAHVLWPWFAMHYLAIPTF